MANDQINNRLVEAAKRYYRARMAFSDNTSGFSLNPPRPERNMELLNECANAEWEVHKIGKELSNG